jgi:2,3-bisphosphoglycerate-dependent phosphoglycerate mutase
VPTLVLLRHGQSTWNHENRFTGWQDVPLTGAGEDEARDAGRLLGGEPGLDLRVVHTSVLTRAIRTAELALAEADRSWLPVRRSWRLNERHYGDLTGRNKKETSERYGVEQVHRWRRSFDEPPPAMPSGDPRQVNGDPRYRDVDPADLPSTECLKDVVARVVPYFDEAIAPDLAAEGARGGAVLVAAHGNSIRALRMHLEAISPERIVGLEVPTGIPFVVELDERLTVTGATYLGDPEAAARAAEEVGRQAGEVPPPPADNGNEDGDGDDDGDEPA